MTPLLEQLCLLVVNNLIYIHHISKSSNSIAVKETCAATKTAELKILGQGTLLHT